MSNIHRHILHTDHLLAFVLCALAPQQTLKQQRRLSITQSHRRKRRALTRDSKSDASPPRARWPADRDGQRPVFDPLDFCLAARSVGASPWPPSPALDLFASRRSAWNDCVDVAWDCFGLRLYATWME